MRTVSRLNNQIHSSARTSGTKSTNQRAKIEKNGQAYQDGFSKSPTSTEPSFFSRVKKELFPSKVGKLEAVAATVWGGVGTALMANFLLPVGGPLVLGVAFGAGAILGHASLLDAADRFRNEEKTSKTAPKQEMIAGQAWNLA